MPAPLTTPVWGDPAGAESPGPLRGAVSADVCVVGLGGSGLAAVGRLLEAGASVVGVDAGPVAGGAAGRNGGFLLAGGALFHHDAVAAWGEERAVGIYEESLRELDRLAAELGAPIVRRVGSLRIPASPEEEQHCADQLAMLRRHGFPAEPADGPSGAGLFVPGDGSVQPLERCRLLARRAVDAGARLFCDSPVTGDRRHAGRHRRGRGRLPRRRGLRGRRDRAALPRARGPRAHGAAADARHRARRAGPVPLPRLRQLRLRLLAAAAGRAGRARRRPQRARRRRVGPPGRAGRRRSRAISTCCCASGSASMPR